MRRAVVMCAVLAGCGGAAANSDGTARAPQAQPAADPAPCGEVAANELKIMSIAFLGAAKTGALAGKIETRCRDDLWPVDVRRCVVTATGFDEMSACHEQLTPAQQSAYRREIEPAGDDHVPGEPPQPPPPPELLR